MKEFFRALFLQYTIEFHRAPLYLTLRCKGDSCPLHGGLGLQCAPFDVVGMHCLEALVIIRHWLPSDSTARSIGAPGWRHFFPWGAFKPHSA